MVMDMGPDSTEGIQTQKMVKKWSKRHKNYVTEMVRPKGTAELSKALNAQRNESGKVIKRPLDPKKKNKFPNFYEKWKKKQKSGIPNTDDDSTSAAATLSQMWGTNKEQEANSNSQPRRASYKKNTNKKRKNFDDTPSFPSDTPAKKSKHEKQAKSYQGNKRVKSELKRPEQIKKERQVKMKKKNEIWKRRNKRRERRKRRRKR